MKNGVTVHSEDVVDSADAQALKEEGTFCLRILILMYVFVHGPDDVCFCQEMVCGTAAGSHGTSECDLSMDCCGDRSRRANIADFPVKESCVEAATW